MQQRQWQWSPMLLFYAHPVDPRYPNYNYASLPAQAPAYHGASYVKPDPLTFVLIHGSWADTSFWDGIAAVLRQMGHTVYVPEYPGHGADPNKAVTHAMLTKSIADYIVSNNLHNIILVGHSFGGSLVQTVAQQVPDRLRRLVFYDAFVLNDGEMVADEFPPEAKEMFEQLRNSTADDTIMLPFPLFRDTFVNLADLALANQIYSKISPEPALPLFQKLDLKKFYTLNTPKSYVYLMEDTAVPQSAGTGWHPHMSSRLGVFRYIAGHGDHMSTPKTNPAMVAHKIYEASRD